MTSPFDAFIQAAAAAEGYLVERLMHAATEQGDVLDIGLRWGPDKPDIVLSFENVHHVEISRVPDAPLGPLEEVTCTVLEPSNAPWPEGLNPNVQRSVDLPHLLWFRGKGLLQISVLAPIATAYTQAR